MLGGADSLAKAIAYLGAKAVGPGESTGVERYAFTFGSHGRYMTAASSTVLAWWASHNYEPPTNGSTPCGVLMPEFWSPESRFAWRFTPAGLSVAGNSGAGVYATQAEAANKRLFADDRIERITASLETGEEVPC